MSRRTGLSCLLMLVCGVGVGQTPSGAPTASPQTAASQAVPQRPVTTIKANAKLVVLDVFVKDFKGHPVHGLKQGDFTVLEQNVPQAISHFEEHFAQTQADAMKMSEVPKMPPGIFTNYSPTPVNGAVNVLLLDTLNTPITDQTYVKQQLVSYLKSLAPGTRIAIFGLNTRLIMLQGFTSDPELLKTVLSQTHGRGSPLLDDSVGGGGTQNSMADDLEDNGADPGMVANVRQFEAVRQSFQLQLRAKYTLDAMNQLARYLAIIPGRKNLIWFSGSFPVSVLPDTTGTLPDPFAAVADSEEEFRQTVTMLASSQVAVYPVDARGLFSPPLFSAASSRNYAGPRGGQRMQQDLNQFSFQTAREQGTMLDMAAATGGHAFMNTNGLTAAIASAIEEGSNFYTMTYVPTNSEQDGKLRKIKVQVNRPGLTLAYRKGYYAERPGAPEKVASRVDAASVSGNGLGGRDALRLVMMRGAPVPTEIMIKVAVLCETPAGQREEKLASRNVATAKMQGPYRRYSVNYAVNPADLNFVRTPDGKVHGDVDLFVFLYTADGELMNVLTDELHIAAPLEDIKKAVAQGLLWHEEISAPAKGEYFLRIGVRDEHKDRYGAVELATSQALRTPQPAAAAAGASK